MSGTEPTLTRPMPGELNDEGCERFSESGTRGPSAGPSTEVGTEYPLEKFENG